MYQLISKYESLLLIFTFTNDDGVIFAGDCTNEAFVMAGEYDLEAGGYRMVCSIFNCAT